METDYLRASSTIIPVYVELRVSLLTWKLQRVISVEKSVVMNDSHTRKKKSGRITFTGSALAEILSNILKTLTQDTR